MKATSQLKVPGRFRTHNDWVVFAERMRESDGEGLDFFDIRKRTYEKIEKVRERPLLVYATKFLEDEIPGMPNSIDISDVDRFTDSVGFIGKRDKTVDVLLHSPGGEVEAVERIVEMLRARFDEVHFLIPHSAYSAATMLALSGNSITMHPSAALGPIDPQVSVPLGDDYVFVPARSILDGFEKARNNIRENPKDLSLYIPLIGKYSLELFELCESAERLSEELVAQWLEQYMFAGKKDKANMAKKVTNFFSQFNLHHTHSRPITLRKLEEFEMSAAFGNDELSKLLWEAHIVINGFFEISPFVKICEGASGFSTGKQFHLPQNVEETD